MKPPTLRDLWLSECWKPCPEWHQTKDEEADARARNATLNADSQPVEIGPENVDRAAS